MTSQLAEVYPDMVRPKTRGDCVNGPRPCPWISCRHHTLLRKQGKPNGERTRIYFNEFLRGLMTPEQIEERPEMALVVLPETCALDVADRGEHTLQEVGELMGVCRERIRQLVERESRRIKYTALLDPNSEARRLREHMPESSPVWETDRRFHVPLSVTKLLRENHRRPKSEGDDQPNRPRQDCHPAEVEPFNTCERQKGTDHGGHCPG